MKRGKKREREVEKKKKKKKKKNHIYSDGNCHGNGMKGAKAGVGVTGLLEDNVEFATSLKLPGVTQTNNRAELLGLFLAMLAADETVETTIVTDSLYAINSTTGEWKAKTNLDLVESCQAMLLRRPLVKFVWTKGHLDDQGNCEADELATKAILS
jgi:ribonuclease HI